MRYSLIANINVIIMKHNIIKINDVEIPKVGQAFHQPLGVGLGNKWLPPHHNRTQTKINILWAIINTMAT